LPPQEESKTPVTATNANVTLFIVFSYVSPLLFALAKTWEFGFGKVRAAMAQFLILQATN
jgi:hypothetical protein